MKETEESSTTTPTRGGWRGALSAIREALSSSHHDFTQGSLPRAILLLAIPMVLEMSMESVFAITDAFYVSRIGDAAVATIGLTESMLTIVYAFGIGFSMAATALVARRIGEKNPEGAARAATQAMAVSLLFGLLSGLPCIFFAGDLLRFMGASEEVISVGSGFTAWMLGSNVVIVLLYVHNAIFRGAGDPALAMRALWLANGINLVLDPCLIFGLGPFPELGVTGAAISTVVGRGTGVAYQLWMLRRSQSRILITRSALRLQPRVMIELLRLSAGGVSQFFIATASWVALMRMVSRFGDSAVAGYTIAIRIIVFAIMPAWGLSNAAATLVGQSLGAGNPDRAERSVWLTGLFNAGFLLFVMVVFLALGPLLVTFFTDKPETLAYGATALRVVSYGYPFYAWGMVMAQAFNGAGDTWTPTRLNLFCFWLFQLPLAWSLSHSLDAGPAGVFWSVAVAEAVLALAAMLVFRRGRWKEIRLAADPS
jgi:putative MATE family efflux protein